MPDRFGDYVTDLVSGAFQEEESYGRDSPRSSLTWPPSARSPKDNSVSTTLPKEQSPELYVSPGVMALKSRILRWLEKNRHSKKKMESQAHNRIFYFERGELSYTDRAEGGLNPFYESCDHLNPKGLCETFQAGSHIFRVPRAYLIMRALDGRFLDDAFETAPPRLFHFDNIMTAKLLKQYLCGEDTDLAQNCWKVTFELLYRAYELHLYSLKRLMPQIIFCRLTQYDDGKPTFRELVYAWKLATGHESEVFRSFVINILYFILVEDIKDNSGLFDSLEKLDADALGLWDVFEETATFRERRSTISLWEWNGKKIQTHLEEAVKEQHCIRRPPQDETFEHEAEDDNECHLSL